MPVRKPRKYGPIVAKSLRSAELSVGDQAAAALAQLYADQIDEAREAHTEAIRLLDEVDDEDKKTRLRITRLKRQVELQQVLAELGPKLLQALQALNLTPAARKLPMKGAVPDEKQAGSSTLQAIRSSRGAASRQRGTAHLYPVPSGADA